MTGDALSFYHFGKQRVAISYATTTLLFIQLSTKNLLDRFHAFTINQIPTLRLLINEFWEYCKYGHLYVTFSDLKATFSSVARLTLWNTLHAFILPLKFPNIL